MANVKHVPGGGNVQIFDQKYAGGKRASSACSENSNEKRSLPQVSVKKIASIELLIAIQNTVWKKLKTLIGGTRYSRKLSRFGKALEVSKNILVILDADASN